MDKYLFRYKFRGKTWCSEIEAESFEDAEQRLNALDTAVIDGKFVTEVSVSRALLNKIN